MGTCQNQYQTCCPAHLRLIPFTFLNFVINEIFAVHNVKCAQKILSLQKFFFPCGNVFNKMKVIHQLLVFKPQLYIIGHKTFIEADRQHAKRLRPILSIYAGPMPLSVEPILLSPFCISSFIKGLCAWERSGWFFEK